MRHRAAIAALFLQAALRAAPQSAPPDAAPGPIILKSTSRAVELDVFVNDPSGRPVHGLQKNDFVIADNGHPRDIRIFAGEIDANQTAAWSATTAPPGVYSNRLSMRDSRIVTAIVIDAVPRPEGLQRNAGRFASTFRVDVSRRNRPDFSVNLVLGQALRAINRMEPGQTMAIYAACPDLRIAQDYTSDPDRLAASLKAFVPVRAQDTDCKKQSWTTDAFVPPMLSALRDVAGRMSGASGRKSVVLLSQAYFAELNLHAISGATDQTVAAFNDANVSLYAVDTPRPPAWQRRLPCRS
jgi:VWFA-related protein